MSFTEHMAAANTMLLKLRGEAPNPDTVLADVKEAGCNLTADGGNLRIVGPLTDDLRARIRDCKPALLRLLAEEPVKPAAAFDFWDASQASDTVKILLARFEAQGWPESNDMAQEAGRCMDAIDDALRNDNLAAFNRAIHRFIEFMDEQFPKRIGSTTYFEKTEVCYSAWVRKSGAKRWIRIASGCPDEVGLEEKIGEYTRNVYKADVCILPDGKDANEKSK